MKDGDFFEVICKKKCALFGSGLGRMMHSSRVSSRMALGGNLEKFQWNLQIGDDSRSNLGEIIWNYKVVPPKDSSKNQVHWLVVSYIFYFHPYFVKWSNLTNIFQMGWNHQLVQ